MGPALIAQALDQLLSLLVRLLPPVQLLDLHSEPSD